MVVIATPRPLYPRERHSTHFIGGWVGPLGWSGRVQSTDLPACNESLCRLSYLSPQSLIDRCWIFITVVGLWHNGWREGCPVVRRTEATHCNSKSPNSTSKYSASGWGNISIGPAQWGESTGSSGSCIQRTHDNHCDTSSLYCQECRSHFIHFWWPGKVSNHLSSVVKPQFLLKRCYDWGTEYSARLDYQRAEEVSLFWRTASSLQTVKFHETKDHFYNLEIMTFLL